MTEPPTVVADEKDEENRWLDLGERIGAVVDHLGVDKCVQATGKSAKQIRRYEKGAEPPLGVIVDLAAASGASIAWIICNNPETPKDFELSEEVYLGRLRYIDAQIEKEETLGGLIQLRSRRDLVQKMLAINEEHHKSVDAHNRIRADFSAESTPSTFKARRHRPPSGNEKHFDYIPIQRLEISASAGGGAFNSSTPEFAEPLLVPKWVFNRLGIKSSDARIITSSGISMLPTIGDGDHVLVNIRPEHHVPVDGMIYVFSVDDSLFVKRLRRSPDGWIMVSDNQTLFPPEPISAGRTVTIHGQIVWVDRKLS